MGSALLSDFGTEIVIPICAVVGIVFSLVQWYLVSLVKLSPDHGGSSPRNHKNNGFSESLVEEEEGVDDQNVVLKCADIQNAISEGESYSLLDLFCFLKGLVVAIVVNSCRFRARWSSMELHLSQCLLETLFLLA